MANQRTLDWDQNISPDLQPLSRNNQQATNFVPRNIFVAHRGRGRGRGFFRREDARYRRAHVELFVGNQYARDLEVREGEGFGEYDCQGFRNVQEEIVHNRPLMQNTSSQGGRQTFHNKNPDDISHLNSYMGNKMDHYPEECDTRSPRLHPQKVNPRHCRGLSRYTLRSRPFEANGSNHGKSINGSNHGNSTNSAAGKPEPPSTKWPGRGKQGDKCIYATPTTKPFEISEENEDNGYKNFRGNLCQSAKISSGSNRNTKIAVMGMQEEEVCEDEPIRSECRQPPVHGDNIVSVSASSKSCSKNAKLKKLYDLIDSDEAQESSHVEGNGMAFQVKSVSRGDKVASGKKRASVFHSDSDSDDESNSSKRSFEEMERGMVDIGSEGQPCGKRSRCGDGDEENLDLMSGSDKRGSVKTTEIGAAMSQVELNSADGRVPNIPRMERAKPNFVEKVSHKECKSSNLQRFQRIPNKTQWNSSSEKHRNPVMKFNEEDLSPQTPGRRKFCVGGNVKDGAAGEESSTDDYQGFSSDGIEDNEKWDKLIGDITCEEKQQENVNSLHSQLRLSPPMLPDVVGPYIPPHLAPPMMYSPYPSGVPNGDYWRWEDPNFHTPPPYFVPWPEFVTPFIPGSTPGYCRYTPHVQHVYPPHTLHSEATQVLNTKLEYNSEDFGSAVSAAFISSDVEEEGGSIHLDATSRSDLEREEIGRGEPVQIPADKISDSLKDKKSDRISNVEPKLEAEEENTSLPAVVEFNQTFTKKVFVPRQVEQLKLEESDELKSKSSQIKKNKCDESVTAESVATVETGVCIESLSTEDEKKEPNYIEIMKKTPSTSYYSSVEDNTEVDPKKFRGFKMSWHQTKNFPGLAVNIWRSKHAALGPNGPWRECLNSASSSTSDSAGSHDLLDTPTLNSAKQKSYADMIKLKSGLEFDGRLQQKLPVSSWSEKAHNPVIIARVKPRRRLTIQEEVMQEGTGSFPKPQQRWSDEEIIYPWSSEKYIDTHCHIDFLFKRIEFAGTFAKYGRINNFPDNYEGCVAIFCTPESFHPMNQRWQNLLKEDNIWAAFGCHPHHAKDYDGNVEDHIKAGMKHPKAIAFGEFGLDYSNRCTSDHLLQHLVFRRQLALALETQKPMVIHSRAAEEDTLRIMKEVVPVNYKIHRHCFTGPPEDARKFLDAFPNSMIGITNLVTFPSAHETHRTVQEIPLERILLETDAPYFYPRQCSKEGRWSHPAMAVFVAERIARLRGMTTDQVLRTVRLNTKVMYGI